MQNTFIPWDVGCRFECSHLRLFKYVNLECQEVWWKMGTDKYICFAVRYPSWTRLLLLVRGTIVLNFFKLIWLTYVLQNTPVLLSFSIAGCVLLCGQYGVSWAFLFWYMTMLLVVHALLCNILHWWSLSNYSSLLQFTLFMAGMVIFPQILIGTFRPQYDMFRID